MLAALCLPLIVGSSVQDNRAYEFLSYKDTVFAVVIRNVWVDSSASTVFPNYPIDLVTIGLKFARGPVRAIPEGWDGKASCFNVACEDFDHVMGWKVDARFPRLAVLNTHK